MQLEGKTKDEKQCPAVTLDFLLTAAFCYVVLKQ